MADGSPAKIGVLIDDVDPTGGYDPNVMKSLELVADEFVGTINGLVDPAAPASSLSLVDSASSLRRGGGPSPECRCRW